MVIYVLFISITNRATSRRFPFYDFVVDAAFDFKRELMKVLVTGSSGHLGEALMRVLPAFGHEAFGLDLKPGPFTNLVGSINDRSAVRQCISGVDAVLHTATLHKPHVVTHAKQAFIDNNVSGTLNLLEEAAGTGVQRFVFTSTTSAFGTALNPEGDLPAAWIDQTVTPVPKNIYGVTKVAAEDLCALFAKRHGVNCIILRTSRFFPEMDDNKVTRGAFSDTNAKANEFLFRRVDIEDVALAHERAMIKAVDIGFANYVISAPSPFKKGDLATLRNNPEAVVSAHYQRFTSIYRKVGFRMFGDIDRVYASDAARSDLGWMPSHDFGSVLKQLEDGQPIGSDLAQTIGSKGYHDETFRDGPYPVD